MTAQVRNGGWKVALVLIGILLGGGIVTGKDYLQTSQLETRLEKRMDRMEARLARDIRELRSQILKN